MGRVRSLLAICMIAGGCRFGFDDASRSEDAGADGDARDGGGDPDGLDSSTDAPDAAMVGCPPNYLPLVGETSTYKTLAGGTTDWLNAEQRCEAEGTHLVVLDSANEKAMLIAFMPVTNLWTGVTDRKVIGQWLKVTGGAASYLPWANSEPDLAGLECVQIEDISTNLRDQSCGSGRVAICECDGLPAMPSTY